MGTELDPHLTVGDPLIEAVISATQLPDEWIRQEIYQLLESSGKNGKSVTLEEFRQALLTYLETTPPFTFRSY